MTYTLEHDPIAPGHLVTITGELDIGATPELSTVLAMAVAGPGDTVILDLSGVAFLDSTALGTILKAGGEIEAAGKQLRVVSGDGPVRRLLELTNLTRRFDIRPTREAALEGTS